MWKILQSVPRGARQSLITYARRNSVREDETNTFQQLQPSVFRHYSDDQNKEEHNQRFKVNDDFSQYMRNKHTLLEALGWGAALTAGIVASRPIVFGPSPDGGQDSKVGVLLDYAAAMPIGTLSVNDTKKARTKVRTDSGFSEALQLESKRPTPDSSFDFSENNHSDFDLLTSDDSENQRLIDSLSAFTINDIFPNEKLEKNEKRSSTANERVKKPSNFSEAVAEFDELCREAYGRHCHYNAIKALKNEDGLKAAHLWSKASEVGYKKGHYHLGRCYESGVGTYRDVEKAKYYYDLAAKQGHQTAMERLRLLEAAQNASMLFQKLSSPESAVKCSQHDSRIPPPNG